MRLIQYQIFNNGFDKNVTIPLGQNINFLGEQESIDKFINVATNNEINDVDDLEKFKFKYFDIERSNKLNVSFEYYTGTTYISNYKVIGFTEDDVIFNKDGYKNSFYIIDIYDNFNSQIQNKVTSMYFTVLGNSVNSDYIIDITGNSKQLSYLYIPINFINNVVTGTTIELYVRFSFFNAKSGNLILFFNNENELLTTEEKYYYKILLNKINKTYKFIINNSVLTPHETINNDYIDKFNRSLDVLPQKQQNYPTGNAFNYNDGTYFLNE